MAPRLDGGCLAWTIVASSFMVSFLQDGIQYSYGLLLPAIASHFRVGRAEAALTSSILFLLTMGSGPLVAGLLASFGHRTVTLAGVLMATLGLLLAGFYIQLVPSEPSIFVLYATVGLITGLGFGLMYLPAMDIVEHYFNRRLGLAMGVACCGSGLGQFVLAPLVNLAMESWGLAYTLYCLAVTVASAAVFALLYRLPEQGEEEDVKIKSPDIVFQLEGQQKIAKQNDSYASKETKSYMSVLSSPSILLLLTSHFLVNLGIDSVLAFSTDRAVQFGGVTQSESSLLLSIMGVSNFLGRIVFGQVLDKFRRHSILLITLIVLTNSLTVLSSDFISGMLGYGVHTAAFGFTFGAYVCSMVPVLKILFKDITIPLGLSCLTVGLASVAGPVGVGYLYDTMGSYTPGFLEVGCLGVLGALLLPILTLTVPKKEEKHDNMQDVESKLETEVKEETKEKTKIEIKARKKSVTLREV